MTVAPAPVAQLPLKRLSEKFVRDHLAQQEASGLSLRKYCKQHGLPYARMIYHRRKADGPARVGARGASLFLPVEIKASASNREPTSGIAHTGEQGTMDVQLPRGGIIRLRSDFDSAALRRLVAVLEGTPC
jgi:hypothetical protein